MTTKASIPYRANSDAVTCMRHKRRRDNPRPKMKGQYCGATIVHLAETDTINDRYRYYHATKGWRSRRARGKTDAQILRDRP